MPSPQPDENTARNEIAEGSFQPIETEQFYDYRNIAGFGAAYYDLYYHRGRPVTDDEQAVTEFAMPFLRELKKGGKFLDIATGPTVHHQLLLAPYFDELHCGDYLEDNRSMVAHWATAANGQAAQDIPSWSQYTEYYLKMEGAEAGPHAIEQRERETRNKISVICKTNLMNNPVVGENSSYDGIGCFYCLEEVARTREGFFAVVANAADLLKPGGVFMISALANSDFYHVKNAAGEDEIIKSFAIDYEMLRDALLAAGLTIPEGGIKSVGLESQAHEGVPGILAAWAVKPIA
jgi:SAM-dependent methyltransferase